MVGSAAGVRKTRLDPVAGNYVRVTGLADLFAEATELSVRTMIFDVEPLVAPWHGSHESLDRGMARILGEVRTVPSVRGRLRDQLGSPPVCRPRPRGPSGQSS